jgi:hypothetical protein
MVFFADRQAGQPALRQAGLPAYRRKTLSGANNGSRLG